MAIDTITNNLESFDSVNNSVTNLNGSVVINNQHIYEKLISFALLDSNLVTIDLDTFKYTPNLERLHLINNKLVSIKTI